MNKHRKKILFLLGDMPKSISNGQILYQYLIIKAISENNDCFVVGCKEENITFLDNIDNLNKRIFFIRQNNKIFTLMKSLFSFTPYISQKYNNKENIRTINNILKKNNIDILHSIYFPSTSVLASNVNIKNRIMTVPDLYSKYYKQLYKNNTNIKYLYNYLSYLFLEFKQKNKYNSIQFVNYKEVKESKFKNANYIPLLINNISIGNFSKKTKNILLPRANKENTIWFLENIAKKLKNYRYTIISNDNIVENFIESNRDFFDNVELVQWVDNYDEYVNRFYLHISIDNIATGLSTKVLHSFMSGNLLIGTELSYRGLPAFPSNLRQVFKSDEELIKLIKFNMDLDKKEYLKRIQEAKDYSQKIFNNTNTVKLIEESYNKAFIKD